MSDNYELLYFPGWGRVDVIRMIMELTGAKYEFNQVGQEQWGTLKAEQKFNQMPRLTVKKADDTSVHIWESIAIELYLAEKLGLVSTDLLERTNALGIVLSLRGLQDTVSGAVILQDVAQRAAKHEKFIAETIPNTLKAHEAILGKSGGIYYEGDRATLPDLALLSVYLRYRDMYAERNPVTNFPKIMKVVDTLLAGKLGEYERERRDPGLFEWSSTKFEFVPVESK
ncbi:hypothetical protein C8J56DRAFT_165521 [Mycena floridula]|nr:hypothetical protein C8J56DRAFT_165521 [Mycena floridula]